MAGDGAGQADDGAGAPEGTDPAGGTGAPAARRKPSGYANYGPGVRSGKRGRTAKAAPTGMTAPAHPPTPSVPAPPAPADGPSAPPTPTASATTPSAAAAAAPAAAADGPVAPVSPARPPLELPHNVPVARSYPGAAGPSAMPAPRPAPAPTLPLGASIALGLAAGVVAASVWFLFTVATHRILVLLGFFIGAIVGIGFAYHADRSTRVVRGILSVGWTAVSLFAATYFAARQQLVDAVANGGFGNDVTVKVLVSPSLTFRMVGDFFSANPVTYAVWAGALYVAWVIPGGKVKGAPRRS